MDNQFNSNHGPYRKTSFWSRRRHRKSAVDERVVSLSLGACQFQEPFLQRRPTLCSLRFPSAIRLSECQPLNSTIGLPVHTADPICPPTPESVENVVSATTTLIRAMTITRTTPRNSTTTTSWPASSHSTAIPIPRPASDRCGYGWSSWPSSSHSCWDCCSSDPGRPSSRFELAFENCRPASLRRDKSVEDPCCITETPFVSQTIGVKGTPLTRDTTHESGR